MGAGGGCEGLKTAGRGNTKLLILLEFWPVSVLPSRPKKAKMQATF
jgi:hypothetical protein